MPGILMEIDKELERAFGKFPPFHSAHEGYAVLLEEMLELQEAVFGHRTPENLAAMRMEAIQVAAMAIRFVNDVCERSHD